MLNSCAPGKWIRRELHKLVGYPGVAMRITSRDVDKNASTSEHGSGRSSESASGSSSGGDSTTPARSLAEAGADYPALRATSVEAYALQGRELAHAVFCLVPAGDYEVSSCQSPNHCTDSGAPG